MNAAGRIDRTVAYPIRDLRAFLAGAWRIVRRIGDRRLGIVGRLEGCATFAPTARGFCYDESGTLQFGAYRGSVTQRYLFDIEDSAPAAKICLADGRPFYVLDLRSGVANVAHDCGADRYRGRYRTFCADDWTLTWRVDGPRKRYSIATRYSRDAPSALNPQIESIDRRRDTCTNPLGRGRPPAMPLKGDML
ncbi:MAG TPA: DUF6314 family protein [Alphaproteobacteria bacterium]|nr:DUF6314 family protein [Alphaproteobacteria bacterium]